MAHILLADDDTPMRGFLRQALERAGHGVTDVADGQAALDVLKGDTQIDLLLTDIVMPGMDGIALSQRALVLRPTLKVMYITGFAAVAMNHPELEKSGTLAPPILSKPFHLKDLVTQVEALLTA
jgi:two-component system, cell cycle response regulator CpdR